MERRRITPFRILLTLLAAVVVAGFITAKAPNPALAPRPGEPTVTVWVVDNGFHTDLAIPSADILAAGGPAAEALRGLPARRWTLVGWGDRDFYTHSGFAAARLADALRALFWPGNPSVVHLNGFDADPTQAFGGDLVALRLSRAGEAAMLSRLNASFRRPVTRLPVHWGLNDGFFDGSEHFHITHLCNHWTGEVLAAGGLADIPVLNTIPGALRLRLAMTLDEPAPAP